MILTVSIVVFGYDYLMKLTFKRDKERYFKMKKEWEEAIEEQKKFNELQNNLKENNK